MKNHAIDSIFPMFLKYIWLICVTVLALEIIFTINTVMVFTKISSKDVMSATKRELENQLDVTWKLADALSQDIILTDTSISLAERVLHLNTFNEAYDLFLIGITDEEGTITSTYRNKMGDIGYRDYFNHAINTGESVITDAFPTTVDETILNYTICVPYYDKESTPAGTIIMSIPFEGVNEIIIEAVHESNFIFTLLDSDYNIMARENELLIGMAFSHLLDNSNYISTNEEDILDSIHAAESGSYWTVNYNKLLYVSYAPVVRTPWTLLTSIDVFSSCSMILFASIIKSFLFFIIFGVIYSLGKRYMKVRLVAGTMIRQVEKLQDNLRDEKLITTDTLEELLSISKSGLLDGLTKLPTRLVIEKLLAVELEQLSEHSNGIFMIIDLDDLKALNNSYGHAVGDRALSSFGEALKLWAKKADCIVGRFGGDEFIAFFTGKNCKEVVENILKALRIELEENGEKIYLHASVGVATYPTCGTTFQELYIAADKALYDSKKHGKDRYTFSENWIKRPHD